MAAVSAKAVFRKKRISNDCSWNHDKFHRNFHFWIQNGRRYGKYVRFKGFFRNLGHLLPNGRRFSKYVHFYGLRRQFPLLDPKQLPL